jgi:hypothetical protein
MKAKTFLAFYLSFVILAVAGIGLYQNRDLPQWLEIIHVVILVSVIATGLYLLYRSFLSGRRTEPDDDEMSVKVLYRAASGAFMMALYMWGGLIYLFAKTSIDPAILFGSGILGMVVLFGTSWLYFNLKGINHA